MPTTNEYTGLILLSGADAPGIAAGLFETLSPFAISILDVEEISIRGRTVMTALIALNINHTAAIEADLVEYANGKSLDLAIDFSEISEIEAAPAKNGARVIIQDEMTKPSDLAAITSAITATGGNITSITRLPSSGEIILELIVTGVNQSDLMAALTPFTGAVTVKDFA